MKEELLDFTILEKDKKYVVQKKPVSVNNALWAMKFILAMFCWGITGLFVMTGHNVWAIAFVILGILCADDSPRRA